MAADTSTLRGHGGFLRYWTAITASGFGSAITQVALQLLIVVTLNAGSDATGLVNGARWLPYLLFGLVAGVLMDRIRRRPVLVLTDLLRAALLTVIPVLAILGELSVPMLMIFMAVFGLMSLLHDVADQSYLPRLVPRPLLWAANARMDQSGAVIQASGPALAGLLVRLLSAPWAVLVDAVSYLVSAVLLLTLRAPEPPNRRGTLRGVRSEALDGLRWVYRHPMLAPLALNTHAWFICNAAAGAVITPYAVRTLGFDALTFGLALAAAGVGALIGALFAVRLGRTLGVGWTITGCRALDAVGWAVVALSPTQGSAGWLVFGIGQLIIGLGMGASNANETGYRQVITPDAMQGRTNGIMRSANRAMIVIGAPLGGLLGEMIGYRALIGMAATGFALVSVTLAISRFRTASLSDHEPDRQSDSGPDR